MPGVNDNNVLNEKVLFMENETTKPSLSPALIRHHSLPPRQHHPHHSNSKPPNILPHPPTQKNAPHRSHWLHRHRQIHRLPSPLPTPTFPSNHRRRPPSPPSSRARHTRVPQNPRALRPHNTRPAPARALSQWQRQTPQSPCARSARLRRQ